MGFGSAFRTTNQPLLPTELQEGAEHAQGTINNLFSFAPKLVMSRADDGTMTPSKRRGMLQLHLENLCKGMLAILKRYCPSSGNETVLNNFINKCLC